MANAKCAKCKAPIEIRASDSFDPFEAMAVFNRELAKRGERLFTIDSIGLCDDCERLWRASRASLQAEYTRRSRAEWLRYKATAATDVEQAERQMPPWFRTDETYAALRKAWNTRAAEGGRRKGDAY